MKIKNKIFYFFLMLFLFIFALSPIQSFADNTGQAYQYVALGDSLAAGFLNDSNPPDYNVGVGYPERIEQGIEDNSAHQVNLNNASVGGYTTSDVVAQLKSNPDNLRGKMAKADLITLDIGANDLLGAIDIENLDPNEMDQVINDLDEVMNQVRDNLDAILGDVREINPDASIYVMGYYNALHYADAELQDMIGFVLNNMLNKEIQNAAVNHKAVYVSTFDDFKGKYDTYLPNPDIHPNEAGYQVIADVFLEEILPALPATPLEEVNEVNDSEAMQAALENDNLAVDLEGYNALSEDDQSEAASRVFNNRPEEGFADADAVQSALDNAVSGINENPVEKAFDAVNQTDSAEAMRSALKNNDLDLNLDDYIALSDDDQAETASVVLDARPDDGFTDEDALQAALNDALDEVAEEPEAGSMWFSDEGEPEADKGDEGDLYFDEGTGDFYTKTSEGWDPRGNLKSENGKDAPWLAGEGKPNAEQGEFGDLYLDTDNVYVYLKSEDAGKWEHVAVLEDPQGSQDSQDSEEDPSNNGNGHSDNEDNGNGNTEDHSNSATAGSEDTNESGGGALPATATSNPLFLLIGSLMTVAGGAVIQIRKKIRA